jgi:hypothetical protein
MNDTPKVETPVEDVRSYLRSIFPLWTIETLGDDRVDIITGFNEALCIEAETSGDEPGWVVVWTKWAADHGISDERVIVDWRPTIDDCLVQITEALRDVANRDREVAQIGRLIDGLPPFQTDFCCHMVCAHPVA